MGSARCETLDGIFEVNPRKDHRERRNLDTGLNVSLYVLAALPKGSVYHEFIDD